MKKLSLLRQMAQEQADNAQSCVFVCTPEFELAYLNAAWLAYRATTLDAEQGTNLVDTLHKDAVSDVKKCLNSAMMHKEPASVEALLLDGCGEHHWFRIIAEPVCNPKKIVIGCVGYARLIDDLKLLDLSNRKAQEQALREAVLAAEEASRMKSTFLANMSHEIRTPLNGVIGFAELALDEPQLSESVASCLNRIKISAAGLLDIINDVLDISKIEAGKIDLENIPFDLHTDIMQPCETIIGARAKEKNVLLYLYAEPVLSRRLVGDPVRLRQVLLNLLANAVKFTNVGIVKVMLAVEEMTDDRCCINFEIKDSGIGMTPDQVKKVFAPFAQADSSTTRKYGGTGLGLTITKNLIEIMGGTLAVESAFGIGSKFSFSLCFNTIAHDTQRVTEPSFGTAFREKPHFSGDVLVCEDNIINQQVIQEHLARVGLQVTVMPNGKQGVDQVRQRMKNGRPFDLILMDIHMPVMDGLEASQLLREMGVQTSIVALTANAMSTDREKCLSQGMNDYLTKPFKAHDLWDCLARHLTPDGKPVKGNRLAVTPVTSTTSTRQGSRLSPSMASAVLVVPVGGAGGVTVRAVQESRVFTSSTGASLDKELGIENAAGDPVLYRKLVLNFVEDNRNANVQLCEALDSGNITLAHRLAHTLKSVAATIGAEKLSGIAAEIETNLSDGNLDAVHLAQPQFAAELGRVLRELSYLQAKDENSGNAGELDKSKAHALLDTLEPLLRKADSEALEYLDAVAENLFPLGQQGQTLFTEIDDYDFEQALATLNAIRSDLERNDD